MWIGSDSHSVIHAVEKREYAHDVDEEADEEVAAEVGRWGHAVGEWDEGRRVHLHLHEVGQATDAGHLEQVVQPTMHLHVAEEQGQLEQRFTPHHKSTISQTRQLYSTH